jgi:hypothetical protein
MGIENIMANDYKINWPTDDSELLALFKGNSTPN